MKQKFDLSLWLQNKSRKVVTRDGRNVRIVCWDRQYSHDDFPIIALEEWDNGEYVNFVSSNGRVDLSGSENIHDLFFADEEEELTDFESDLFTAFSDAWQQYLRGESVNVVEWAKEHSKDLLESARKELKKEYVIIRKDTYESEEKAKAQGLLDNYKKGKQDVLKDLPKWKRNKPNEKYIHNKGYYLTWEELEKLPKEE